MTVFSDFFTKDLCARGEAVLEIKTIVAGNVEFFEPEAIELHDTDIEALVGRESRPDD